MSNKGTKGGKVSIKDRFAKLYQDINFDFNNKLSVPGHIKSELDAEGMDCRWINAAEFNKTGGHQSFWIPYVVSDSSGELGFGVDAEGHLRRADLILAVRPKEITAKHKQHLAKKNEIMKNYNKKAKAELKREVAKGVGITVEDGDFE